MNINPSYLMIQSRVTQRTRMEEADRRRIIREATLANPTWERKIWLILRNRWQEFWNRKRDQKIYPPVTRVPGNLHSA